MPFRVHMRNTQAAMAYPTHPDHMHFRYGLARLLNEENDLQSRRGSGFARGATMQRSSSGVSWKVCMQPKLGSGPIMSSIIQA